ncbi:hypothetical protein Ahy_B08g092307 [Arachis hypogaea]|uniref:RNase H type-1 domain-containing protein n=1 Tax=Arachis hypogaea TaxID=3818 RepID=A0A444Y3N1_ARAHY|nr:hypothetical protein Ahy_B08g092307 [Arachis hypogaea]
MDEGNENCWNQFTKKRIRCKKELMKWNSRKVKRADKEIERKKRELHLIQEAGEGWDRNKIMDIFPGDVADLITKTPISMINQKDFFVWSYKNDGQYSVKIGYHKATQESSTEKKSETVRRGERKRITWRPPPRNRLKANTDAAFHKDTGTAALAVVVRDWQGKVITGTTATFKTISALTAEAQAYREAFILIKNLQIPKCIIETDCLPLIQAIKSKMPIAKADAIFRDILQLLEETPDVGATWTPRDGNKLAHQLAAMAAGNDLGRQWTMNPPAQVRNTIRIEASFATIQHVQGIQHQGMQIQVNMVPDTTTHQELRREERLPRRVEIETRDKPPAEDKEQNQPTVVHQLAINSHTKAIVIGDRDRGGGSADRAVSQVALGQGWGNYRQNRDAPGDSWQFRRKPNECEAAPAKVYGGRVGEAGPEGASAERRSKGQNREEFRRIRDGNGSGERRSFDLGTCTIAEDEEHRGEDLCTKEEEDQIEVYRGGSLPRRASEWVGVGN